MGNEWQKVTEDGREFWVNEKLGNIVKLAEDQFVCLYPKIIKLGPFKTIEEAQNVLESKGKALENLLDSFNADLINLNKVK